jgi:hypothetical protein
MPRAIKSHIAYIVLSFILVFAPSFTLEAQVAPPPPQNVVILVDSSESVTPYLSSLVGIMSRFVTGARYGDSITCYQFSKQPVFFAGMRIEQEGDIARVKSQIAQLRSVSEYTNYSPALERAMEDIETFYNERPGDEIFLILITDGRRYGQDTSSEQKAFNQLLRRYSNLRAGTDYFFYCFFIGSTSENDLESYIRSCGGYFMRWPEDKAWLDNLTLVDVRASDAMLSLPNIPSGPTHTSFTIGFYPRRPPTATSLMELSIEAAFAEKTLDRFFDVNPRRFLCQKEPWRQKFDLELRGFGKGDYSGTFVFQPSDPRNLLLSPRIVNFGFKISEPLQVIISSPLTFGPTDLRGEYEEAKYISIVPGRSDFPSDPGAITVTADIDLPEGVELQTSSTSSQREILINITVARSRSISKEAVGEYEGNIRLDSQAGWALATNSIPVSVKVSKREAGLGKVKYYIAVVIGCIVLLALIILSRETTRMAIKDYFARKTRPTGKLVITNDPTRGLAKSINLDRLSEKQSAKEILVGVGKGSHVELPHRSMMDKRYMFSGFRAPEEVHTIVQAIEGTDEVVVNNISRTGEIQLRHLDTLKLGAFEFRYETPEPLSQAVLYFLSGDVWQGWPLSWNTESEGFSFLRRDTLPDRKEAYVRFYELKAIAFVRDFEGELTKRLGALKVPRDGHHVRLIFADQEELTGYIFNWKDPGEKFYFLPEAMGDNILFFLVERHTVKEISVLEDNKRGAERAEKELARVIEPMKRNIGKR